MSKLLSRQEFEKSVFQKNNGKCAFCNLPAQDAHHILDRKLWIDGGYYQDNGCAVCAEHHWKCEDCSISVEQVRDASFSTKIIPHILYPSAIYDKWANVEHDGMVVPGFLWDSSIKKTIINKTVANFRLLNHEERKTYHTIIWPNKVIVRDIVSNETNDIPDGYYILKNDCESILTDGNEMIKI